MAAWDQHKERADLAQHGAGEGDEHAEEALLSFWAFKLLRDGGAQHGRSCLQHRRSALCCLGGATRNGRRRPMLGGSRRVVALRTSNATALIRNLAHYI